MTTDGSSLPPEYHDPRMRGFRARSAVVDVLALIGRQVARLGAEEIDFREGAGRVLAGDVVAPSRSPPSTARRWTAMRCAAKRRSGPRLITPPFSVASARPGPGGGAGSSSSPARRSRSRPDRRSRRGPTRWSRSKRRGGRAIWFRSSSRPRPAGMSAVAARMSTAGTVVLHAGRVLRPQDLGVLSALGGGNDRRHPPAAGRVIVTGDELLAPGTRAEGCRLADMNSVMLAPLIARDGGLTTRRRPAARRPRPASRRDSPRPRPGPTPC